jgi:hypothetical protein
VLLLAAVKLQEQRLPQEGSAAALVMSSSSNGSENWTFGCNHTAASPGPIAFGNPRQPQQGCTAEAQLGDQDCVQRTGSQLLLQRYLSGSSPAVLDGSAAAAAAAAAAGCVPVQLCAAEGAQQQQQSDDCQQQQMQQQCCGLMAAESEPSSECATATSSTADQHSSCCGGYHSDTTAEASPGACLAVSKLGAAAASAPDVAAQCDMLV